MFMKLCFTLAAIFSAGVASAEDRLFAPMAVDQVKAKTLDWAAGRGLTDKALIEAVGKLWAATGEQAPAADELHDRAVQTAALVDPVIKQVIVQCQFGSRIVPESAVLASDKLEPFMAQNLRAFVVKFMAQSGYFDEGQALAKSVDAGQLIDPASFLFFKAVCEHRLLLKKDGLATLKQLRHDTSNVPVRYVSVAELMEKDLEALEEKSLNEVSRLMSDAERRLGLGRGGERVQKVEEEIISRLDEIIKKLEAEKGGGGGSGSGGGSGKGNRSNSPAEEARLKGAPEAGEVDPRDIGKKSGWGALPPKVQAKAKNLIDRDLPPHYRSAIEQYLKKLATRPEAASPQK